MPVPARGRTMWRELGVALGYFALTLVATYPLVATITAAVPSGGDIWVYYWDLWWVKRALIDLHRHPFFTSALHFPSGATLYFHVLNLVQSVVAIPVVAALGLTVAYNFLVLLSFTLTGYATYRLALYVLTHDVDPGEASMEPFPARLAAFVAGIAFTFSSYRFAHMLGHLDLVSTQWLPLAALALLKTRDDERWRYPVLCGLSVAAAALTSSYYLLFLLLLIAVLAIHILAVGRMGGPMLIRLSVVLDVFAIVLLPILIRMFTLGAPEIRSGAGPAGADAFSADLLSFVVPSNAHSLVGHRLAPLYASMFGAAPSSEHVAFLGFVPLALAALAIRRHASTLSFWIASLLLFVLLALGPTLHIGGTVVPLVSAVMPYRMVSRLPYGDTPGVPVRFVVMALMSLSVLAGAGVRVILEKRTRRQGLLIVAILSMLMLAENAVAPIQLETPVVPAFFDEIARDPATRGVLEVPIPDDPASALVRMLYQTHHGKPIFQGYVAHSTPPLDFGAVPGFRQLKTLSATIDDVVVYPSARLAAISRGALIAYDAGHVVIEKSMMPDAAALQRARFIADDLFGSAAREYEDDQVLAYAVPRSLEHAATVMWLGSGWSYLEHRDPPRAGEPPIRWRWMGDRASLAVFAAAPVDVRLKLTAGANERARPIRVTLGTAAIATLSIAPSRADYETPAFRLPSGFSTIEWLSLDGSGPAGADPRPLSVALFGVQLLEIPDRR